MSIRRQMVLLLVAISTVFIGTTWMMHVLVIAPAFAKLERDAATQNLDRCKEAVDGVAESVSTLAADYGAWDDTCLFVADRNQAYRDSNLSTSFHSTTGNDLVAILTTSLEVLTFKCVDPISNEPVALPELQTQLQSRDGAFTVFSDPNDSTEGLVLTRHGLMMVVSRPIVTSNRQGPILGTMVMGRFLNKERISEMCHRTHCQMDLQPLFHAEVSNAQHGNTTSGHASSISEIDENTLLSSLILPDAFGVPVARLSLLDSRPISHQAQFTRNAAMTCSVIGVLLMILGTGIALRLRIIEPLQTMASHAKRVGVEDDLSARLNLDRGDEIGVLAKSFDHMVAHLAEARRRTEVAAHRDGMAEIASEVLHNVGNAVSTANCCVELISDRLSNSRFRGLEKATSLLSQQNGNAAHFFSEDPRGPKLISYLVTLNETLQKEQQENQAELRRLQETICHIRDAIASQQSFARRSDFRQSVELLDVVNESLLVNEVLQKQCHVKVIIDVPTLPPLELNRSRVAQVLVNLEKNAILSMQSVPDRDHVLTIRASVIDGDTLQIEVCDTGTGFTPEIHERLFGQGYTTRKDGSGLGLHYCVNVIREMGGDIHAHSDGPGTGATFRFTLPRAVVQPTHMRLTRLSSGATELPALDAVEQPASKYDRHVYTNNSRSLQEQHS